MTDTSSPRPASGLRAEALTLGYGSDPVVTGLDLRIPPGAFTGLLGPNGSGKSTLLRALARLHPPRRGAVLLDGTPLREMGARALARQVGLLPQGATAPEGLNVTDLVRQGRYPHRSLLGRWTPADEAAVAHAMDRAAITDLRERPLDALSGGQRQRVWIAMVLAQDAPILLLDEPTTYLDLAHQIDLMELIRDFVEQQNMTIVAVLHDLNQAARYCDHLVMLKGGQIVARGDVTTIFRPDMIEPAFGVAVDVLTDPRSGRPYALPRGRSGAFRS
ncbi:ABC transporter ATP-binding protein [Pseudooceanicola aestuarii]|uniref:ABC transporter ATP-binding protein n=1 Tax=Pseudooceanicola aestuarii TaxID=2697319 RepID=UPI0013D61BAF|nr:ABC transporter ATP-binding protein [Pseudooceanicola aestuarii]